MVTNKYILCGHEFTNCDMYESINKFIMMNMECYKIWIKLYNSKISIILRECALFCSQNPKGTPPCISKR